jgi:hypothetical protein
MRAEELGWPAVVRQVRRARDALRAGPQGGLGDVSRWLAAVATRVDALEVAAATQRTSVPAVASADLAPLVDELRAGLEGAWAALEAHATHLAALQLGVEQLQRGVEDVRGAYGPQLAEFSEVLEAWRSPKG